LKVLIITYYWVPAGGSGVQRWLNFVKYLRDYGIEPVIFTVYEPNYPITDASLQKNVPEGLEIIKNPIWEPNENQNKCRFFKSESKFFWQDFTICESKLFYSRCS